ncbi:MAG: xylose isomerase [Phycisphaerae bacterium]|nr:xylose isomerase [Phycisphaerae bacterium]MDW8262606.1 xylose isomerase [Phycisphaerales bacterium]
MARDPYQPDKRKKFTFGLWTVGNIGRDPFGAPTRGQLSPARIVDLLGECEGVYGVNFHDNDLIPIDASPSQAAEIKRDFRKALKDNGLVVPMATTNLFSDPVFKDGAFTSNNARIRAYAIQKTMRAMDLGAEFGAKIYVFWGGREGVETDAAKDPVEAIKRFREAINFLCEYSISQGYGYKFAFEAKPNEPRGHIYFAVTGSYLHFIESLDHPEMCGVNPEVAHEHMAGLNFVHQVAAALEAGKLFHIDLNDQEFGRYDQDFRFGSANLKHAFFLVKLLEEYKYDGPRHFDSHAYRQSDYRDVKEFARGSMRTYMILAEKARRWMADKEIQGLLKEIQVADQPLSALTRKFSAVNARKLLAAPLDRIRLAEARLPYEKLDQLTMEVLMGIR